MIAASPEEVRIRVARARSQYPTISASLEEEFVSAGLSTDEVALRLYELISAEQPEAIAAKIVASAPRRSSRR